jgi:hypothetical protein
MKEVFSEISKASEGKYGHGVLYAGAVGLILSDIIPTPADAVYFYYEKKLRDQWKSGKISPKQYWSKSVSAYYLLNPIWWTGVLATLYYVKGDVKQKAKIGLAVVGVGAVIGIIYRNYRKDIGEVKKEVQNELEPKVEFDGGNKPKVQVGKYRSVLRRGNQIKFIA